MAARIVCGVLLLGLSATDASAKPELKASDPAPQAVLTAAPREVMLTFSEPIEPAFSNVSVLDGSGRRIDVGHVDRDLTKTNVLHVWLFGQAQGTCRVIWHVVGADKRSVTGQFVFQGP